MTCPPHRPYYHWPSFLLHIVKALHAFAPWSAICAELELLHRELPELDGRFEAVLGSARRYGL